MSITYVSESPNDSFYERQLPNGGYRYEGYFHTVHYCIDSPIRKQENEIDRFLSKCSVAYLINHERCIIELE